MNNLYIYRYTRSLFLQNSRKICEIRPIFQWLNIVFNQVDHLRIKELGPDRVCAEWLLRNGAFVQWVGAKKFITDYNILPSEDTKIFIEKVDATDSSISHYGFLHFRGCNYIQEIKLNNCIYIENNALKQLSFVKNSLEYLQVAQCDNITGEGLLHLRDLTKLKILKLSQLHYVKEKENVIQMLKNSLPNCQIESDFEKKK